MPASRTAVQKNKSQWQSVEANQWHSKDAWYGDHRTAYAQFSSEGSLPEMHQWARITSMPASLPHRDGHMGFESGSSSATTCEDLTMLRQFSESSQYEMSMTMSPSPPGSSSASPCQCVNPQTRKITGLPGPITKLIPADESIDSAGCFAAGSMSTPQRAAAPSTDPITACAPLADMPLAVWNRMLQMGQVPLFQTGQKHMVVLAPASWMDLQEVPCSGTAVAAEGTWPSSVQRTTSKVPRCPWQHGTGMVASRTSSSGVAPAVLPPCGSSETVAVPQVHQHWLNELEAIILKNAMPECYED